MARKKIDYSQEEIEEIERRVQEKIAEHEKRYTPTVECKYGQTFVSFEAYSSVSWKRYERIYLLLKVMDIDFVGSLCSLEKPFFLSIKGENEKLAEFIRRFIDNEYVLKLEMGWGE